MNDSPPPLPEKPRASKLVAIAIGIAVLLLALGAWMEVVISGHFKTYSGSIQLWPPPTPNPGKKPSTPTAKTIAEKSLELGTITTSEVPDENATTHFILRIPIKKAQADARIDVRGMVIHVLFYDRVNGNTVVQTSADVKSRWAVPPADWTKSNTEELDVEYNLPKRDLRAKGLPEDRQYYGYLVRLYYEQQLQGATATPDRLALQYPAPPTLAKAPVPEKTPNRDFPATDARSFGLAPAKTPPAAAATPTPATSLAGGPTLDLFPIKTENEPDENAIKRLQLHIPIKATRGAQIDVKDVVIHVLFYDLVDGKNVAPTLAGIKTHWATPPADWIQSDIEELIVEYLLPKPAPNATAPPEDRKYFGYLVRVYYKGKLQAATAEPDRLAREYPAPPTLSVDSNPTAAETPDSNAVAGQGPEDFTAYARKMRERAIIRMEPEIVVPTASRWQNVAGKYPWKTQIVTTVFWVGEKEKGKSIHKASAWDPQWETNYGGFDNPNPAARNHFIPSEFIPRQNPFYVALPYNDVAHGTTKPEAKIVIPWFRELVDEGLWKEGQSVCRHRWLAIRSAAGKICYAQWSDCGPFTGDHWQYVFGNEKPRPNTDGGAGLQVSPAIRDYLELVRTDVTDWKFVEAKDVPNGPWKLYGEDGARAPRAPTGPTRIAATGTISLPHLP